MPSAAPPPPSRPPPTPAAAAPEPEEESGTLVVRFGTAVGVATLAAAVASIPATMRVAAALPQGPRAPSVWLACVSAMVVPMVLAVVVLRRARVGLRSLGGADATARGLGVVVWLLSLFLVLAVVGSVLRATTHHHALAGTTFAILALGAAIVLGVLSARLSAIIAGRSDRARRVLVVGVGGGLVLVLVVASLRFARAFTGTPDAPPAAGAFVVDVLAFAIAALFASRPA